MTPFFAAGTTRVLDIEVSSSRMNVIEVDAAAAGVRVTNSAVIDYLPDAEELAYAQLRETFDAKGITTKRAVMSIAGTDIGMTTLQLPPLSKHEREIIVRREAREAIGASFGDYEYHYRVLGRTAAEEAPQDRILLTYAPRQTLIAAYEFIQRCGLRLERITPLPLALAALVRASHPLGEIGLLYLADSGAQLVVVDDGEFRFHRKLQTRADEDAGHGPNLDFLGAEIRSSLLYFRQQFRGERVEKLLVCGDGNLDAICQSVTTATQVIADPYDVTSVVDPGRDGASIEFQPLSHAMTVPLGLALSPVDEINLLPMFVRPRSGSWALGIAAALALVLLCGLVWGHYHVSAQVEKIKAAILIKEHEQASLSPLVEHARATQRNRAHDRARVLFLEQAPRHAGFFPQLLNEVKRLVPASIILHSLDISRTHTSRRLNMTGEVVGNELASALAILEDFYQDVQRSPFLVRTTITMNHQPNTDLAAQGHDNTVSFLVGADLAIQDLLVVRTGS